MASAWTRTRAWAASRLALASLYLAILFPPSKIDQLSVTPSSQISFMSARFAPYHPLLVTAGKKFLKFCRTLASAASPHRFLLHHHEALAEEEVEVGLLDQEHGVVPIDLHILLRGLGVGLFPVGGRKGLAEIEEELGERHFRRRGGAPGGDGGGGGARAGRPPCARVSGGTNQAARPRVRDIATSRVRRAPLIANLLLLEGVPVARAYYSTGARDAKSRKKMLLIATEQAPHFGPQILQLMPDLLRPGQLLRRQHRANLQGHLKRLLGG